MLKFRWSCEGKYLNERSGLVVESTPTKYDSRKR